MEGYPKLIKLKDETEIYLRPLVKENKDKLTEFFQKLPKSDRMFLKDDVADPKTIELWIERLDYDHVLPILAETKEGDIVGDATLHQVRYGWLRHIGEVRVVIDKRYRKKGLGSLMMKELFHHARERGLDKIEVNMIESQVQTIKMFTKLGFKKIATLPEYVLDLQGNKHSLVIMMQDVRSLVDLSFDSSQHLPVRY